MSDKKSKKPVKTLAKNLLLGIPTNIAAGPLGFRAELDIDPKGKQRYFQSQLRAGPTVVPDKKSPGPSRIVFHKKEVETEGLLGVPETSTYAVVVDDVGPVNPLTGRFFNLLPPRSMFTGIILLLRITEGTVNVGREEGGSRVARTSKCRCRRDVHTA